MNRLQHHYLSCSHWIIHYVLFKIKCGKTEQITWNKFREIVCSTALSYQEWIKFHMQFFRDCRNLLFQKHFRVSKKHFWRDETQWSPFVLPTDFFNMVIYKNPVMIWSLVKSMIKNIIPKMNFAGLQDRVEVTRCKLGITKGRTYKKDWLVAR